MMFLVTASLQRSGVALNRPRIVSSSPNFGIYEDCSPRATIFAAMR